MDKEPAMTSHDVVAKLRQIFGLKRIGHGGTLDPDATGLLVVALGNITRLLDFYQARQKVYRGEVVFGSETDSYDSTGRIVRNYDMTIDADELRHAVNSLVGDVMQVPPIVSAKKVAGKKLYEYHRESKAVDIMPRQVRIDSIEYSFTSDPSVVQIEVACGSGTYIRSIAHDLGHMLGGGAHLRGLRRIRSGGFAVEEACRLAAMGLDKVLGPAQALRDFRIVPIDSVNARVAKNGSGVELGVDLGTEVILFEGNQDELLSWDQVIGLYSSDKNGVLRPRLVLSGSH